MKAENTYAGEGTYNRQDAARLVRFSLRKASPSVPPQFGAASITRWLGIGDSEPLWRPRFGGHTGGLCLTFRELIELRFIAAFRAAGLSFQTIRKCFAAASEAIGDSLPFSSARFRTDGRTIFLQFEAGLDEAALIDLKSRHYMFKRIIEPSLQGLEFENNQLARWNAHKSGRAAIVLDPLRSFGAPIIARSGIPTSALAQAAKSERGPKGAAWAYDVPEYEVNAAVAFEKELMAA